MKRLLIISLVLFISLAFGQSENPCEDVRYLEIKKKSLDEMSNREYDYFTKMDEECKNYQKGNSESKGEIQNQQPTSNINETISNSPKLNDEQLKEFNKRKLSIEIVTKGIGSFNTNIGLASGESWRKWTAYKGFDKISEEQFFSLSGYKDESKKAKGYRNKNIGFIVGGILGSIFGIVRVGTAIKMNDERYDKYGYQTDEYFEEGEKADGIALQGSILFGLGVGSIVYGGIALEKNWAPYATVESISEEYNNKLIKEISNK